MAVVLEGSTPVLDEPSGDQFLACGSSRRPIAPTALGRSAGRLRLGDTLLCAGLATCESTYKPRLLNVRWTVSTHLQTHQARGKPRLAPE